MTNQTFINALKDGDRNRGLKDVLIDLLCGATITIDSGKPGFTTYLMQDQKGPALALANWDGFESCSAKITHDLHSFECWDLGWLVSKLRTE